MLTQPTIDWDDVASAAEQMAGNWRKFNNFVWHRGNQLADADRWLVFYAAHRDSGLLAQSNHAEIAKRLEPFTEGADPDVVPEAHSHWAVGHIHGFAIRVYKPDGSTTPAFEEFCRIKQDLDNYPILNESDYSDREYQATLENYRSEMWRLRDQLPEGWEGEVYNWFSDNGFQEHTENRDDQGGWAPKQKLVEALQGLGLLPSPVADPGGQRSPAGD
jgi:hypothetical protein